MADKYKYNSAHKDFIRDKWVEFIQLIKLENPEESGYSIITFPSEEMTDLKLFAEKGLIEWETTETGSRRITKGSVVCFEKDASKHKKIATSLTGAKVEREFGNYITNNYIALKQGKLNTFPIDAVNLDYEKLISKNEVPIDILVKYIFEFQSNSEKDFCLFLTWPKPFEITDDDPNFINSLRQTISNNLTDPNAVKFKEAFSEKHNSIEEIGYEPLSIIGITKQILKESSNNKFSVHRNEFYTYGEDYRQSMISVLYYFKYVKTDKAQHKIYAEDVVKAMDNITNL